jgi:hypothetical protein
MQLVEQEPLWGRFGYSDLKGAALRSRSYVFSIGLGRMVWIAGLVLRTVWGRVADNSGGTITLHAKACSHQLRTELADKETPRAIPYHF